MFKLYTKEELTLPFQDYALLMDLVRGAKTVLEFGPGLTTLALIEAGVENIVSLESDPEWLEKKREDLKDYPQVKLCRYWDEVPVVVDMDAVGVFDIAVVDAPAGFHYQIPGRVSRKKHPGMEDCSRLNTCLYALDHAPVVLLHDAKRPLERGTLGRLNARGHSFELFDTHSGLARIRRNGKEQARPSS